MKAYKYDLHVHTAETSACGKVNGAELVHMYKDAGYHGVVITDHFYIHYFDSLGDIPWEEKIEIYMQGYNNALEEGKKVGLEVILGMEITFTEHFNDYLVYGIDKDFLINCKGIFTEGISGFRKFLDNQDKNVLVCQAHPFRPGIIQAKPPLIDGFEVFNGNPRHNSSNDKAYSYAEEHKLIKTSGSDFHQTCDLARGGIIIPHPIKTSEELAKLLLSNTDIELITPTNL